MLKIVFLFLLPAIALSATESEGFIRRKGEHFYFEKGLDSRVILPGLPGCDRKLLSRFEDHYVLLGWSKRPGGKCFKTESIKRIVYDPLKGTLSPFRKKKP